jgi:Ca2+-binding EF-hand superfamily protein
MVCRSIEYVSNCSRGHLPLPIILEFVERKYLSTSISEQIKRGYQLLQGPDGLISTQSLSNGLIMAGRPLSEEQVRFMIDEADTNCDGFVSETELNHILLSCFLIT